MSVSPLSNSASISTGQTVITLASAVDGLTQSLLSGYIISLNGHPAVVNRTLTDSQIELVSAWNYDSITNGTLFGIATVQGFTQHVEQLNLTNTQLQTALTAALEKINAFKSAAEKDTVANGGSVVESANLKPAAYKEVGTEDGKVLPAEALTAYIKEFITVTDAAEARDKIAFNDGLSPLELSKLMNPMVDLFKKNKGLHHYAGTATFTSGPGTYRDRYGDLQASAENELREEEDGFLFYDTYTNYALHSDTLGVNPGALPWNNPGSDTSFSEPDIDGWVSWVEGTVLDKRHNYAIPTNGEVFSAGEYVSFSIDVKPLGAGADRKLSVIFAGNSNYSYLTFDITNVSSVGNAVAHGIKPTADGYACWAVFKVTNDQSAVSQFNIRPIKGFDDQYDGDGVSGLKVKNLVLTRLSTPPQYVKTTDAPATRTGDQLAIENKNLVDTKPFSIFIAAQNLVLPADGEFHTYFRGQHEDSENQLILSSYHMLRTTNNALRYWIGSLIMDIPATEQELLDNHKIVIAFTGLKIICYFNGTKVAEQNYTPADNIRLRKLRVGSNIDATDSFNGPISDFIIYDYALSEAAIKAL